MSTEEKKIAVIAALAALAYWLYTKYGKSAPAGTTTTTVQTTMLSSGQTNAPTTTVYDTSGNPMPSNEELAGVSQVQTQQIPANVGPAVLVAGGYVANPGYKVTPIVGRVVPVMTPIAASPLQKITTGPAVSGTVKPTPLPVKVAAPKSQLINAGTFTATGFSGRAV